MGGGVLPIRDVGRVPFRHDGCLPKLGRDFRLVEVRGSILLTILD